MEHYVALDVSLNDVSVCILDEKGEIVFEGKTAADPSELVNLIRSKAPGLVRVGLETGATTPWLFHALTAAGLPVICMDVRHANAALSMRPRKSDRSDAHGHHVNCSSDFKMNSLEPTRSDCCGLCSVGSRSGAGTRRMSSCSG
jgi:transposase